MKVEILSTLKGSSLWRKGLVFDDTVAPIPGDVLKEVQAGSPVVKVTREQAVAEKPIAAVKTEIETIETVEQIPKAVPEKEESNKKFKCTLCPWEGKTAPALKRHVTLVHK